MRVVPIANEAGSAGKTTTTVTLAALLAGQGRAVVVVDLDAQANATSGLGVDEADVGFTSGDVLLRRCAWSKALIDTEVVGVQLIPANRGLSADVRDLDKVTAREHRLKLALRDATADVVLVDCPGAVSVLTMAALVAARNDDGPVAWALTVTTPTAKELEGIPRFEDTLAELVETGISPNLQLGGIVPCMVPGQGAGALYQQAMDQLRAAYGDLVTPMVRRSVRAAEAFSHRRPLPLFAPSAAVTQDYRDVLAHLVGRGVL